MSVIYKHGFYKCTALCGLMFHSCKFAAGIKHMGAYISCDKACISACAPIMLQLNPTSVTSVPQWPLIFAKEWS